jgi:hypothetical protein
LRSGTHHIHGALNAEKRQIRKMVAMFDDAKRDINITHALIPQ